MAAKTLDHVRAGNGAAIFRQAAGVRQKLQGFSRQAITGQESLGKIKGLLKGKRIMQISPL
jgi:hypothetical protein